jgi:diguanylate cyclase
VTFGGTCVFYLLVRSGWSRRWHDPSLTLPQMVFALSCTAVAYALLGTARGAALPVAVVALMFGMFVATPRQLLAVGAYAVAIFGATMALMARLRPHEYPPAIEGGHFLILATMLPGVSLLAARLSRLRERARAQRAELARALTALREQTTRDELTGLVNHRHLHALMQQELQRCVRSGQTFCVAMFDIDRLANINQAHGYAIGDTVLRTVAQEALRHIRVCDVLARWGGEVFLLMLTDTRAALARGGLERLHQRLSALRIVHGAEVLGVTLSGGLAEHHAGETVEQTLARAEQALREAKAQGRDRIAVAP